VVSAQKVTVVVPTYNERENLPEMAERLFRLPMSGLSLLVVDDNSPDGTGPLAEELGRQHPGRVDVLHRPGKQGLATAYLQGFQRALERGAEAVVQMDCDLSHRPEEIPAMLQKLQDADVVVGSRYVRGGSADPSWGLSRRMLSRFGNVYARVVLGLRPRDVTSGFKAYRREALERLALRELRCKGFAFQAEIAYRCKRAGLRVTEHPIVFTDRSRGASKMSKAIIVEALVKLPQLRWKQGAALHHSPRRNEAEEKEPGARGRS
jgi:dolichol-phosphate mannosyltransferase